MYSAMPEHNSDGELANEFVDFFMEKITIIHNNLENTSKICCPEYNLIFKFTEFSTLSEDDVRKMIMSMETKSCESDIFQHSY